MRRLYVKAVAALMSATMAFAGISYMPVETKAATSLIPTGLEFVQNNATSATIKWNVVGGATAYNVYEAESRFSSYTKVATVSGDSYTDSNYDGGYYKVAAVVDGTQSSQSEAISFEIQTFGQNTFIFEETDDVTAIQDAINDIYKNMEAGQFSDRRYAVLFKPSTSTYNVKAKVGFYTQVAGLGLTPKEVDVKEIECLARWMTGRKYDGTVNYSALCNFWRSVENMSSGNAYTTWAVSQATSMRKMNLYGSKTVVNNYNDKGDVVSSYTDPNYGILFLHDQGGYASGGFLVDSKISTMVSCGSQQQWLSRNIESGVNAVNENAQNYQSAVWNSVLVGCSTSIKNSDWDRGGTNTVVEKTPIIAEKPYLIYNSDSDEYGIVVPKVKENTVGVSWENMTEADYDYISLKDCYVAKPTDSAKKINTAISGKKALVLTPGIYETETAIEINKENMVVLGLGLATIKPTNGNQCMTVSDVDGVRIAGVLFDAGNVQSDVLFTVGTKAGANEKTDNPNVLSDCFFRVGGADSKPCKTKVCVVINKASTICDNFWVWRADHGAGVAWDKNTAENGIIINGEDVTAYGLMVEHFQKVQTTWNGDGGRCYMYQSELPYDIKSQNVWNEAGSYGFTDYKVSENVKKHEGYGIGIYSCYQAAQCRLKSAITCPDTPDVKFTNVCTYSLVGNGTIDYAINNAGYQIAQSGSMCKVFSYCNKVATGDGTVESRAKDLRAPYITIESKKSNFDTEFKVKYTGKEIKKKIKVSVKGINLIEGIDYTVTYKNNKKIGNATITVKGINNYKGAVKYKMKIVLAKSKLTGKVAKKKKITVKFSKVKGADGYEVSYSTSKKFTKKTTKIKTTKKLKLSFKRKKNTTYYVRVRAYKKVGSKKKYSDYSSKMTIKK